MRELPSGQFDRIVAGSPPSGISTTRATSRCSPARRAPAVTGYGEDGEPLSAEHRRMLVVARL
jgi:hypothetical protein